MMVALAQKLIEYASDEYDDNDDSEPSTKIPVSKESVRAMHRRKTLVWWLLLVPSTPSHSCCFL
jgi:hypothetical protein